MQNNNIIIYGGSSLISKELLKILSKDYSKFIIFCRNRTIVQQYLNEIKIKDLEVKIFEVDLLNLEENFSIIDKLENTERNLEDSIEQYDRMLQLNYHIQNKFRQKAKEINQSTLHKDKKKSLKN